jgi:predicted metal-binding membrane protein
MLVMFGIGMGHAAWMALVAVAMGVEKNFSWGSQLTPALGTLLVTAGITVLVLGSPGPACAC